MMSMSLGKVIVRMCRQRGWSLARLARVSGVPKPTLHGWTTGRNAANLSQLKRVASVLEVSIHELAFGVPDPFASDAEQILEEVFRGDVRVTLHRIGKRGVGEQS